jgi:hypothetical protein
VLRGGAGRLRGLSPGLGRRRVLCRQQQHPGLQAARLACRAHGARRGSSRSTLLGLTADEPCPHGLQEWMVVAVRQLRRAPLQAANGAQRRPPAASRMRSSPTRSTERAARRYAALSLSRTRCLM